MCVLFKPLEDPSFLTPIIIISVTFAIWQLIAWTKMKNKNKTDLCSDSVLIRAIIISRGPNGSTLENIKRDYMEQVGQKIEHYEDDQLLRSKLESIEYVRSETSHGKTFFFAEAPSQKHLAALIRSQKSGKPRALRRAAVQSEAQLATPKTWANSLIFRRNRMCESSLTDESLKFTPSNEVFSQETPKAPKRTTLFSEQRDLYRSSSKRFCPEVFKDSPSIMNFSSNATISRATSQIMEQNEEIDPFMPKYYKCLLVGDNFFLNLAVMNMGFRMMTSDRILQSGYCVSGLTINEARRNIEGMPSNQIIILNIGSTDIAQGKELIDLICDASRLFKACIANEISPILTTIAPLANYRTGNRAAVTSSFNEFLMHNQLNFPVIDLHKKFLNNKGQVDLRYYQPAPRHVSGMRNPLVFWNRFGHQTIMRILRQELGSALLQIIMK